MSVGTRPSSAIDALSTLVSIEACNDVRALAAGFPPIVDPVRRARVDALHRELARARTAGASGRHAAAQAITTALVPRARALGWTSLLADVLVQHGAELIELAKYGEARAVLEEAAQVAGAARRDDAQAAAFAGLTEVAKVGESNAQLALATVPYIRPTLARLPGSSDVHLKALLAIGAAHIATGEREKALAHFREAEQNVSGTDIPWRARVHLALGEALSLTGLYAKALPVLENALAESEQGFGRHHEYVARALTEVGFALASLEIHARAIERLREAVRLLTLSPLESPRRLGRAKLYLGYALRAAGQQEEALAVLQQARSIFIQASGPHSPALPNINNAIGNVLLVTGRFHEARASYQLALDQLQATATAEPAMVATTLGNLGETSLSLGETARAIQECSRAVAAYRKIENELITNVLDCLGQAYEERGDHLRAIPVLREAVQRRRDSGGALYHAVSSFALARALWASGQSKHEAVELARAALPAFEGDLSADPRFRGHDVLVRGWLAARGGLTTRPGPQSSTLGGGGGKLGLAK